MIAFALVFENNLGDCHELLTGRIDAQAFPGFLLAVGELNRYLPQLRVVVNSHVVNVLTINAETYRLFGEPVPQWPN